MRKCPVCDRQSDALQCPVCGFDGSQDFEHFPTLAPTLSIAARRKAWKMQQEIPSDEEIQVLKSELREALTCKDEALDQLRDVIEDRVHLSRELEEAQKRLDAVQSDPPPQRFLRFWKRLWRNCFDVDAKDGLPVVIKILCLLLLIAMVGYVLLDLTHRLFLHTSLAFDDAPCGERGICAYFPCDVTEQHKWADQGCLMPRKCLVCGTIFGGTDSHIWCDADGDGVAVCHLCDAEQTDPFFYRVYYYQDGIKSTVSDHQFIITFPEDAVIPSGDIVIRDHTGSAVGGYSGAPRENKLSVRFSDPPPVGKYTVYIQADGELVPIADEYFGQYNVPTPTQTGTLSDFSANHLLTGLYLAAEDGTLSVHRNISWKDAPVIGQPSELIAGADAEIITVKYLLIQKDGTNCNPYTFEHLGRYLAVDNTGNFYWSDTLTDDCYWLVLSQG